MSNQRKEVRDCRHPTVLCVTSRTLCPGDFLKQVDRIAAARPAGLILREKDLSPADYQTLARQVMALCGRYDVPCILHTQVQAAQSLGCRAIHLPLPVLRTLPEKVRRAFSILGTSCHAAEESEEAAQLGCTYLIAGHIFATRCKEGLPPRGLAFLQAVCHSTSLPVWAIGGITPERIPAVQAAGAAGGCMMSSLMTCADPAVYLSASRRTYWPPVPKIL